jgi:hypothetical protein
MTELANNSFFCFSCLGASHYRAGRGGGAEGAGRRGRSEMEQRKSLGKETGGKKKKEEANQNTTQSPKL